MCCAPDIADVVLHSVVMFGSSFFDIRVMVCEDGFMSYRCIQGHSMLMYAVNIYISIHIYIRIYICILICMHSCIHC